MLIILDYDKTYTEDKDLWDKFILNIKEKNHKIICCTYRLPGIGNDDVEEDMGKHKIHIVYAAEYKTKREAVLKSGYNAWNAIWIDDMPELITGTYM